MNVKQVGSGWGWGGNQLISVRDKGRSMSADETTEKRRILPRGFSDASVGSSPD